VVNLDEGLPRTVEYFRQALNASLPLLERPMAEVAAD
jgi:hypothetical protein